MTSLPVIPPESAVPTHDNTMMSTYAKCARLYKVTHVDGMRTVGKSAALRFGILVHAGLKKWYDTWNEEETLEYVFEQEYSDPAEDHRTKGRAIVTLAEYFEHWKEDRGWFENSDVLLTETGVRVEDPEDGFRWGGRIDLVFRWKGGLWVMDHKTTSMGGPRWWDQWELTNQMGGYVYAASLLHGQPIQGVVVNRITVTKKKQSPELQFERRPYLWPAWKVNEWKEQAIRRYHQIARSRAEDLWPPNWDACIGRYGKCPMHSICTLPPGSRARAIRSEFEHDPWDWMDEGDE